MSRRLRLALGGGAALVIAGVLVAPVVLSGEPAGSCSMALYYLGRPYAARSAGGADAVQAIAIGVGITRGCGSRPENVGVRSLAVVAAAKAVAVGGELHLVARELEGPLQRLADSAIVVCDQHEHAQEQCARGRETALRRDTTAMMVR